MWGVTGTRGQPSPVTLGDRARDKGDWDAAAEHYRQALTRNPDNPPIWVQYGHALKERGRRLEAEAAYRRAVDGDPASADAHLQLGHVLKLRGSGEEAKAAYLRALALDPALADARRELAALGLGDREIAAARAALPPPPRRRRPSRITLADRARELGHWAEAARLYREALARNPRNAPIWVQYGHMLRQQGDLPAAETAYRRALAHDPRSADAHLQLGHALKQQGKTKDAQSAYLRAFALEPTRSEPLGELRGLGWTNGALEEVGRTFASTVGEASTSIFRPLVVVNLVEWETKISLEPPSIPTLARPIGIFVHIYYEELSDEIADYLAKIDLPKRIYISTTTEEKRKLILESFQRFGLDRVTEIVTVPNYGADIASFLIEASKNFLNHDICLKIHGKKSSHARPEFGEGWRNYLYQELMLGDDRVRAIVNTMLAYPDIGILVPEHYPGISPDAISIGRNYRPMSRILDTIGIDLLPDQEIRFPVG